MTKSKTKPKAAKKPTKASKTKKPEQTLASSKHGALKLHISQMLPAFKKGEKCILLVASPTPLVWFPEGWAILTHDKQQSILGWSIGPEAVAGFSKWKYHKDDLYPLREFAQESERQVLDLLDSWIREQPKKPKIAWRTCLYFPERDVALEMTGK